MVSEKISAKNDSFQQVIEIIVNFEPFQKNFNKDNAATLLKKQFDEVSISDDMIDALERVVSDVKFLPCPSLCYD